MAVGAASPSSLVSFLEGAPAYYQRTAAFGGFGPPGGGIAPWGLRRYALAGWFQDDIKLTRSLTMNLGLRYEFNSVPYEIDDRLAGIVDDPSFDGGKLLYDMVLNPNPIYFPDYRGFAPRFGLAYKLTPKTVFRGGYAIFTNLPMTQAANQQAANFPFAGTSVRPNPPFSFTPLSVPGLPVLTDLQGNPLPPPGGTTKQVPPNSPMDLASAAAFLGGPILTNLTDMGLRNGYTMTGNVTLERELPWDTLVQAAYLSNNAAKLFNSAFPNAYVGALPQYTPYTNADPGLSEFQLWDNHGHSTYNALQLMIRKASPKQGLQFQASYTHSKEIDNASTVLNGPATNSAEIFNNPFCWRCEKSVGGFDFPNRFVANFLYQVPFNNWKGLSGLPQRLTKGWEVTSIISAQSGFPFTVNSPFGTTEYGTDEYVGYQGTRPDLVQPASLKTGPGPEEQFFSNAVVADGANLTQQYFVTPGCPTLSCSVQEQPGSLGRNTFRTHPFSNVDFSVIKDTKLTEKSTLQFRGEFFNIFNQHAFNQPGAELGAPNFGIASSTVLNERQIQFALRLIF